MLILGLGTVINFGDEPWTVEEIINGHVRFSCPLVPGAKYMSFAQVEELIFQKG